MSGGFLQSAGDAEPPLKLSDLFALRQQPEATDPGRDAKPVPSGAAAPSASLALEGVERHYGGIVALAGVSLDVAPGEIVCLLGPSGCGKTTLLRIASGVERPTAGRVLISGEEVAGPLRFVPPERRHVGLMFQDFALFPHLTILDNVTFGLKAWPRDDAVREAQAMLVRVGMLGHAAKYPHMLSGGEQQRVALARALAPRPSVMLMDEPFSGLDVQLRERLQEETTALLAETGATSIIVTHHPEEAMRLADRIAVMRDGRLVQVGGTRELHRNPSDLFVARLFSEINEIPWTVEGGALRTPIGTFPVPEIAEGETAVLCLRQREIVLGAAGAGPPARIAYVKPLGDAVLIDVAVQGFDKLLRVRVGENDMPVVEGAEVSLVADPSRVLVFPADQISAAARSAA
jgi:iron(III) transport system ATP-binding protein